jgi:MFS family permease
MLMFDCSGNEIGPFRAIEESTLAQLTPAAMRSDVFAWYALLGTLGAACGNIACGWVVQRLQSLEGWDPIRSYRMVFFAYAGLGLVKLILACALSQKCEAEPKITPLNDEDSLEPLLRSDDQQKKKRLLPQISTESRGIVVKLCILFAVDSMASGLVPA